MGRLRLIAMGLVAATVLAPLMGCSNAAAPAAAPGAARPAAAMDSAAASPGAEPVEASPAPAVTARASQAPQAAKGSPAAPTGQAPQAPQLPQGADTARAAAALPVEAVLTGLPAGLQAGSQAVEFSVVLTNRTATAYPSLAPMLALTDGSDQALKATLERFDPESGSWKRIRVPSPGAAPIGSMGATPYTLPAHGTLTVKYRIAVPAGLPSLQAATSFYAIGTDGGQIGLTGGVLPVAGA
ncbi:hypothetical protein OG389_17345 [Streptomyces sp. NBC_00435]|uniref:hypothetical protein n=1 Tax=Streptomyces sp. NBC_00435 TaxID=2903649 RepID=UPI002E1ED562